VEEIIIGVFGAHGQEAIRVANCESRLHPGSISRNGANWGLFQINTSHRQRVAAMGYRWEDPGVAVARGPSTTTPSRHRGRRRPGAVTEHGAP